MASVSKNESLPFHNALTAAAVMDEFFQACVLSNDRSLH